MRSLVRGVPLLVRMLVGCCCIAAPAAVAGCGGGKDGVQAKVPSDVGAEQIDSDALSLLPGSAVALVSVDARALYASESAGKQLATLTEKLVPIGEEAGFRPSRDVDRVFVGSYSMQGIDVAAVVVGRFDKAKIEQLAKSQKPVKDGGVLVESTYAGRTLYTVNNIGFCVLTAKTALAGTEGGMRRALDRIRDGRVKRSLPSWMAETVETRGAAVAAAADLGGQATGNVQLGSISLPWLRGLTQARLIGQFKEPGLAIAGSLTYGSEEQAQAGADGVKQISSLANMLALTGVVPRIHGLEVAAEKTSVSYKFAVDDQALRGLLASALRYSQ